jgi:CubicO group peptidase (beta-lactamase class C family)
LLDYSTRFLAVFASGGESFFMHRTVGAHIRWIALALVAVFASLAGGAEIHPESLRQAAAYSASHGGCSFLVIQGGRVLAEDYANGGSPNSPMKIYSGTKSFFCIAALIACQEGLVGLDEPASRGIHEWRGDGARKNITIRELMDFTSGLDACFRLHSKEVADRNAMAIKVPLVARRGEAFTYGPSHGQVLCEVLQRKLATRGETPFVFLKRRLLDPLGIGDIEYRKDQKGAPLVASGFRLTARQWAKFGLMVLGRGSYRGRKIVDAELLEKSFQGSRANPMFGFGFWTNRNAKSDGARAVDIEQELAADWDSQRWRGRCISLDAPPDLVAAVGSENQRLFVIPSLDMVVVRQGKPAKFSDAEFLRLLFNPGT